MDYNVLMKVPFQGAIDCDLHPAPPRGEGAAAVSRRLLARADRQPAHRPACRSSSRAIRRTRRSARARTGGRQRACRAAISTCCAAQALDPFGTRLRDLQHAAWRVRAHQRGHGRGPVRGRQRLGGEGTARPRAAPARIDPGAGAKPGARGRGDRAAARPTAASCRCCCRRWGTAARPARCYWPIYEAAEKHGLPIGIHAGSTYRHAPTAIGLAVLSRRGLCRASAAFESQLLSLLAEGVFQKFPALKFVLIESGFTWLPTLAVAHQQDLARRAAGDSLDRPAAGRHHPRSCALHAAAGRRAAGDAERLARTLDHIGSDRMLLFSTDYPHWHFDGEDVLPDGLVRRHAAQAHDRQSARDLSAPAR